MKVVIIGGGIAGLALGILLDQNNIDVVVCERTLGMPSRGHAFLMHNEGIAILQKISDYYGIPIKGKVIDEFILQRPDGHKVKHQKLSSWQCIKRVNLIHLLYLAFADNNLKDGKIFSHFIYEGERVIAAVFEDGTTEYGDIFVGADGGNSAVREALFGKVRFTPVEVKEIIGISNKKRILKNPPGIFTKFQSGTEGLAFGYIPTSGTDYVWFMQFDTRLGDVTNSTADEIKTFCNKMLKDFPPVVKELLGSTDFQSSYIWHTRDFDLLPTFHKNNVVLIGDAAHLALPFTSAGTTNALKDAETLLHCLIDYASYELAFTKFYELRAPEIASHVQLGRDLKAAFLNPQVKSEEESPTPLFSKNGHHIAEAGKKCVKIVYFTDPICSTCWIIQPFLRKFQLEYGDNFTIEYKMGGLLPSWDEYGPNNKVGSPMDAAKHWEEVCLAHQMPLDGDIWFEDPLYSSYPPSIAFKAAQLQDLEKAELFLRRIKEMVFLEKKNIIKWQFLEKAALSAGLDAARLQRDFEGRAPELFRNDLQQAKQLGVTGFPTMFFSNGSDKKFVIKGFQPYEKFEEAIHHFLPNIQKQPINTDPECLFNEFQTMTEKEFAFLSNITIEKAREILNGLYENGIIDKFKSKNGVIWSYSVFSCSC